MASNERDNERLNDDPLDRLENRHKICAYCDKEFYLPYIVDLSQYAYRLANPIVKGKKTLKKHSGQLWFCSWGCMSKFRKSHAPKRYKESAKGMSITDRIRNNED